MNKVPGSLEKPGRKDRKKVLNNLTGEKPMAKKPTKKMDRDLDDLLQPDKDALDKEWVEHSDYVYLFLDEMAEARIKMDAAKDNIEVVKAELDSQIRKDPQKFGLEKLTETLISNTIILLEDYGNVLKQYLEAKEEYYQASNACTAMEHRKSALENLVVLHGRGYWADPIERKDVEKETEKMVKKRAVTNLKKKVKKSKKGE
jgi:hypothetical protein